MKLATGLIELAAGLCLVVAGVFAFASVWSLMAGLLITAAVLLGSSWVLSAR